MATELETADDRPVENIKRTLDERAVLGKASTTRSPPIRYDSPGVGFVVEDCDSNDIAGSILRARKANFHVFAATGGAVDQEAIEFAQELGATIVDSGPSPRGPEKALRNAARRFGFPGLIYSYDPSKAIDLEESREKLFESDRYAIEAVTTSRSAEETGITVGVPAYMEEVSIGSVVLNANRYADEVIVVDDGSTDDTAHVAEEAGATVIEHEENRGKGAAIKTLLDHVDGDDFDTLVLIDGDGQHSAGDIESVAQPVLDGEADVVIGSRYLDGRDHETPTYRRLGQRMLDVLTNGTSRTNVTDSQSGFRALSPDAVRKIELASDSFSVESEMIERASDENLDITERPIDVRYEGVEGPSESAVHHGLSVTTYLLLQIRDRHPLLVFSLPGALFTFFGVLYGIDGILIYQSSGVFYPAKAMVSGFVTIIGVLGIFLGLVLNSVSKNFELLHAKRES